MIHSTATDLNLAAAEAQEQLQRCIPEPGPRSGEGSAQQLRGWLPRGHWLLGRVGPKQVLFRICSYPIAMAWNNSCSSGNGRCYLPAASYRCGFTSSRGRSKSCLWRCKECLKLGTVFFETPCDQTIMYISQIIVLVVSLTMIEFTGMNAVQQVSNRQTDSRNIFACSKSSWWGTKSWRQKILNSSEHHRGFPRKTWTALRCIQYHSCHQTSWEICPSILSGSCSRELL